MNMDWFYSISQICNEFGILKSKGISWKHLQWA